jgi:hypothetical protein
VAGPTASRYILSAWRSTYWSTGRCCGAPDIGAAVCERAPTSAARDRDLLPETVPKRRADAGAVTTYHRRVPSRPGVRPAVPGAGFTRAQQKGEGR